MATKRKTPESTITRLIITEEENPTINLKPGMKFKVATEELVDPTLKRVRLHKGTEFSIETLYVIDYQYVIRAVILQLFA